MFTVLSGALVNDFKAGVVASVVAGALVDGGSVDTWVWWGVVVGGDSVLIEELEDISEFVDEVSVMAV